MAEQDTSGDWLLLILDQSDRDDPRWVIARVAGSADVRPAQIDPVSRRWTDDWPEVADWVAERAGRPVSLVPVSAVVWRARS